MPSSSFRHGFEAGGEGLLLEGMRRKIVCMHEEKGGGSIYGAGMPMGAGGGGLKTGVQIYRSWE